MIYKTFDILDFPDYDSCLRSVNERGNIYYDGVLVHSKSRGKVIAAGQTVSGKLLTDNMAIALWQRCYLADRDIVDADQCARVYRNKTGTCHRCCGEGTVDHWIKIPNQKERQCQKVTCPECLGTGIGERKMTESECEATS